MGSANVWLENGARTGRGAGLDGAWVDGGGGGSVVVVVVSGGNVDGGGGGGGGRFPTLTGRGALAGNGALAGGGSLGGCCGFRFRRVCGVCGVKGLKPGKKGPILLETKHASQLL